MEKSYTRLTVYAVLRNPALLLATIFMFAAPVIAAGVVMLPFYVLGTLIGGLDLWLFTGLFAVYPAIAAGIAIGTAPLVSATVESSRNGSGGITTSFKSLKHAPQLAKWGIVVGVLGPLVRLSFINGNPGVTGLNDMGYMGRRAIFYAPQTIVIEKVDNPMFQDVFEASADLYQTFHGSSTPTTCLSVRLRRIGVVVLGSASIVSVVFSAFVGLAILLAACIGYVVMKHISHTLLYLYNTEGNPIMEDPYSQLTPELYESAFSS